MSDPAQPMAPGQIASWSMGAPPAWGSWPPREGAAAADAVAADLADGPEAQSRVREGVLAVDAGLPPDIPIMATAVWVPDRASGEVCGVLVAELLVDVPAVDDPIAEFLRLVARPPKRRGERTFEYSVARAELPAGPAGVQSRTWSDKASRTVRSSITWTVVAPGATEAVGAEFSTTSPALQDALIDEAIDVMHSLVLEIA